MPMLCLWNDSEWEIASMTPASAAAMSAAERVISAWITIINGGLMDKPWPPTRLGSSRWDCPHYWTMWVILPIKSVDGVLGQPRKWLLRFTFAILTTASASAYIALISTLKRTSLNIFQFSRTHYFSVRKDFKDSPVLDLNLHHLPLPAVKGNQMATCLVLQEIPTRNH